MDALKRIMYIMFVIDGALALAMPWALWILCALLYGLLCAAAGGLWDYMRSDDRK